MIPNGMMPPTVIRHNYQLIFAMITMVTTIKNTERTIIDMLVLSPSYTTVISLDILESRSPVFTVSK